MIILERNDDPKIECIVKVTEPMIKEDADLEHYTGMARILTHMEECFCHVMLSVWDFEPPKVMEGCYLKVKGRLIPQTIENGKILLHIRIDAFEDIEVL